MRARIFLALGCLVATLTLPVALRADSCTSAGNLVANCSFSTGNFSSWTVTRALSGTDLYVSASYGHNGDYSGVFGGSSEYDTISQTLNTTSSQVYTLTFWLDNQGAAPGENDFQALWNGTSLLDETSATNGNVEYTYTVTGIGSDTLEFEGWNNPARYALSDVSVTAEATALVPEGAGFWMLLCSGLAILTGMVSRRYV
jgi:hypothetical protein